MPSWSKENITSFFRGILPHKRQEEQENPVSIAETITQMQESRVDSPSFATIVFKIASTVNKMRIRCNKQTYSVGDIVNLKPDVIELNWIFRKFSDNSFIVVKVPAQTDKFKTYALRVLDGNEEESWQDYNFHEDFLTRK